MNIEIETSTYNQRRYGKPWIAKVEFTSAKGEFTWGEWVGNPGSGGLLTISVDVGDVVARGQKDHRGRGKDPQYYIVVESGGDSTHSSHLRKVDKVEAYRHWKSLHSTPK